MTQDKWIEAIADAAEAWRDPDLEVRADAVQGTLEASNRYTEEGLAFALNHRMHTLTPENLRAWVGGRRAGASLNVGVLCRGAPPLDGLTEVLAALLLGHRVMVGVSEASPALVPAFIAWMIDRREDGAVQFVPRRDVFGPADVLVAAGDEDVLADINEQAEAAGIPASRRWLRRTGLAVAVIDGTEDAEARSGLAEDLLLHEGTAPRSPRIVWAPADLSPDAILDTLAGFRELYPPHPASDGALRLPTAFLASTAQPHAAGPGFLLSKGEPEPQSPGHVRWTEYDTLDDVAAWLRRRREDVAFVVARPSVAEPLGTDLPVVEPGEAHRPGLGGEVPGLVQFLAGSAESEPGD